MLNKMVILLSRATYTVQKAPNFDEKMILL